MHMYVHPQRQSDTHPHEHTLTYTNAGCTMKIVSELIIFILSSKSHFWIGVLMQSFLFFLKKKIKKHIFRPELDRFEVISSLFGPNWPELKIGKKKRRFVIDVRPATTTATRRIHASWTWVRHPWKHPCFLGVD